MTFGQDTKTKYNTDEIKAAATGRELDILRDVAGIDDSLLDDKHHPCPKCGGKDRFRLIDREAGAVLCNQCFSKNNGDFFAAVQWAQNVSFPQALAMIGDYLSLDGGDTEPPASYGVTTNAARITEEILDQTAYLKQCAARIGETDYLRKRGISDETAKKYGVGYDRGRNEIIFPRSKYEYTARRIVALEGEERYRNKGKVKHLFGEESYNPETGGPLFLTEGAIDALSIIEVGGFAMALSSATNTRLAVNRMREMGITAPVLIALDSDNTGHEAADKLELALLEAGINAFSVNINGNHKDPNVFLLDDKKGFAEAVMREIETAKNRPAPQRITPPTKEEEPTEPLPFIPFPTDALPEGPIRALAEAYRDSMQKDAAYIAPLLLAGIASIFGCSRRVLLTDAGDYSEPLVVWSAVVTPSGSGKSPALNFAQQPFIDYDDTFYRTYQKDMKEYRTRQAKNKKATPEDPPYMRECTVSNITVEALAETLFRNPYGVCSFQDELAGWFKGQNQYKKGGNDETEYLSLYNGKFIKINRKTPFSDGTTARVILNPALSIAGGIQPGILKQISRDHSDYSEAGLFFRFLLTMPPDPIRTISSPGIDASVLNEYHDLIFRLFKKREDDNGRLYTPELPQIFTLTYDASTLYKEFDLENERERGNRDNATKGVLPKMTGYSGRIAGVLHMARYAFDETPDTIDADTMFNAIEITRWFRHEAFRVASKIFGSAVRGAVSDQEDRRVVDYLRRKDATTDEKGLTPREIARSLFQQKGGSVLAEAVLFRLRTAGVLDSSVDACPYGPAATRYFLTEKTPE